MRKVNDKALTVLCVLALVLVIGFPYFHVGSKEIASFGAINENCEVEIVRHDSLDNPAFRTYALEGPQIEQLKRLLMDSSFTRRLNFLNKISYETVSYSIYIYFDERQEVLYLSCWGRDLMFISSSFEGKDHYNNLKMNNKHWKAALEEILQSAQLLDT